MNTIKRTLLGTSVALALMAGVGTADASLLTIDTTGKTSFSVPSNNDVLPSGFGPLWKDAGFSAAAGATLTYYFLGSESSYTNTLHTSGGNSHPENNTIPGFPGTLLFSEVYNGTTPVFWFTTPSLANVAPGTGTPARNIALTYLNDDNTVSTTATNRVLFALDDSGAGPDADYDDYVGYVTAVPVPAAVWLFGSALIGLAGVGRRKLPGTKA